MFITITRDTLCRIGAAAGVCVTLAVLFFLLPQADAPAAQANAETEAAVPASRGSRPSATYPRIRSASGTPTMWATPPKRRST